MKQFFLRLSNREDFNEIFTLFIICLGLLGIAITRQGVHNVYTDTVVYVDQILFFKGELANDTAVTYHFFKPLYGILGSLLYPTISLYSALFTINVFFFFGLTYSFYYVCKKIGFTKELSFAGALWVASGYPLLKYGLALLTDISGWFFTGLTLFLFLIARERKYSKTFLVLASLSGFLGSLSKETGVLGLIACGLIIVLEMIRERKLQKLVPLAFLSLPILLLQGGLMIFLVLHSAHTAFDWIAYNLKTNMSEQFHTFYYFIMTEGATFHILWLYAILGIWYGIKEKLYKVPEKMILGISFLIATIPALFWPLFYVRIFYIQYIIIIPLALLGLHYISKKVSSSLYNSIVFLPVLLSVILFLIAGHSSLFDLLSYAKHIILK